MLPIGIKCPLRTEGGNGGHAEEHQAPQEADEVDRVAVLDNSSPASKTSDCTHHADGKYWNEAELRLINALILAGHEFGKGFGHKEGE